MKKLMFIATAALCGAVMAADDGAIVSANVVGYQNYVVTNGTQGAGVTFKNVGGAGTMADLKITGYGESYGDNGIYCQKLNGYGAQDGDIMFWADYTEEKTTWYGWYNADWDVSLDDVPLAAGEGVWLTLDQDAYVQSSGEVIAETLPVAIKGSTGGYSQLCPNPTPVAVKMGNAEISGYGESYSDNGIYCCLLDKYGRQLGNFMFWADYTEEKTTWYGWYNADWDVSYNDETLNPGQSIWLTSDGNYYINWPSPLAK